MKSIKSIFSFSLMTICLITFSCKQDKRDLIQTNSNVTTGIPPSTMPTANSESDITSQLKWIAKGYAGIFENLIYRNWFTNYLIQKDWYEEKHLISNSDGLASLSVDFDDVISLYIDSNFYVNDYNNGYYFGFEFDGCNWETSLRLVDTPILNLPWVVTYESWPEQDTVWGYFLDSVNVLDSIQISSQNFEDYLVFCVCTRTNCVKGRGSITQTGCNNNGICEPDQGEDENCSDCQNNIKKPGQKSLQISWVQINNDKKMFDEAWIQNKYELGWDWAIANGVNGKMRGSRDKQDRTYNVWKPREIYICRRNCKGTVTKKQNKTGKTLYFNYEPLNEDIYFYFWEMDRRCAQYRTIKNISGSVINFQSIPEFDNLWCSITKGGTFHKEYGMGAVGEGVIVIPAGSSWTIDLTYPNRHLFQATSPSGEITMQLEYWD